MILLLSEIMPTYSRCAEKKLVYIIIIALSSRQPSLYIEYTKLNMHLSYNIKSVFNAEYMSKFFYNIYSPSQLLSRNIHLLRETERTSHKKQVLALVHSK